MRKKDIDAVYDRVKSLQDKTEMKSEIYRGEIIDSFLSTLTLLFKFNGELEACKKAFNQQGISIWQKSTVEGEPKPFIPVPLGFMSVHDYVAKYKYPHVSTLTRIVQCDSAVMPFGKKLSKNVFVEPEKVHAFFLTDEAKGRYPRIYKLAHKYEKENSNEHQRKGEADSQNSALL